MNNYYCPALFLLVVPDPYLFVNLHWSLQEPPPSTPIDVLDWSSFNKEQKNYVLTHLRIPSSPLFASHIFTPTFLLSPCYSRVLSHYQTPPTSQKYPWLRVSTADLITSHLRPWVVPSCWLDIYHTQLDNRRKLRKLFTPLLKPKILFSVIHLGYRDVAESFNNANSNCTMFNRLSSSSTLTPPYMSINPFL